MEMSRDVPGGEADPHGGQIAGCLVSHRGKLKKKNIEAVRQALGKTKGGAKKKKF